MNKCQLPDLDELPHNAGWGGWWSGGGGDGGGWGGKDFNAPEIDSRPAVHPIPGLNTM